MTHKLMMITLLLGSLCLHAAFAATDKQPLDQMIAIVNDDVISRSELDHALENAKMMITQERVTAPSNGVLKKQVLDQLINKKIQLQIAKQSGIEITDNDVDQAISKIAKQNHMSVGDLYERISQDGMTSAEYRTEIHDQMTIQKLQQQEVANKMTISPQEVTSFMQSHAFQENAAKEYHLQDILIPISDTPSTEEIETAKQHADGIVSQLNAGKNFEQMTLSESHGNQALQGGDLGWRKLPEIPSAFAEQVTRMKPKTIAGPIQTPNGFHIIKLVESRALSAKQTAASRKMIEAQLMQQKFEEAVQNWVSRLRGQAFVVVNA